MGLHLRFSADDDSVRASFTPSPHHQGFGGIVHGGIITTVLDEAMAWAVAHAGFWAMTGDVRVRFRRPLQVGEVTVVSAHVSGVRGRLVSTVGEVVLGANRTPIATATATFVKVGAELEAAWRARYLRESETITAESRDNPRTAAATGTQRDADLTSEGAHAPHDSC